MASNTYCANRCDLVGNFPVKENLHIISANLKSRTEFRIVPETSIYLEGPTTGDLSITAYAPLPSNEEAKWHNGTKVGLWCLGKAGASYTWNRRIACDDSGLRVYMIPGGPSAAYKEGAVTSQINLVEKVDYDSFSASAASGPFTIYSHVTHTDGHDFVYNGSPIPISSDDAYNVKEIDIFVTGSNVMPQNYELYLTSFTWDYTPPNIPTVSYSFLFLYQGGS